MAYPRKRPVNGGARLDHSTEVERVPLYAAPEYHHRSFYEAAAKSFLDRLAGVVLSILTLPLVLLIVPGIWITLGAPAIYRQRRVGQLGREFTVYKFRTMLEDRRVDEAPIPYQDRRHNHKSADDPRHIPYGRFLRKWSLDEIPQFWNIALGDMSVVGPRPELPSIVARYESWQHRRHEVKPGLTGLWQITARGDTPMHEATDIDIDYVENITFADDLRIMLRTPAAALGQRQGR